ncbi:hypothetical protein [Nostoc sp. UHCC 0302]
MNRVSTDGLFVTFFFQTGIALKLSWFTTMDEIISQTKTAFLTTA